MQRVVITGYGIVSCLGNNPQDVLAHLQQGQSGIGFNQTYADKGLKSQISGSCEVDGSSIDRKLKRFMGDAPQFAYVSAIDALAMAGLSVEQVANNPRIGVIAGSGGASTATAVEGAQTLIEQGIKKVPVTYVPRIMGSTVSAAIATGLKIQGINYSISSACATSAHCIGNAVELIQLGKQDMILAGGAEEEHWTQTVLFDAMGAISSKYNEQPHQASRPYSKDRDGFVIAGGGGIVVLESLEHAQQRGATILAEVVGYGASSDGYDMVAPSGEGAARCMTMALNDAKRVGITSIDYINTHGTSTPVGDSAELKAIKTVFDIGNVPAISSTKSMSGHSLGAAGVHEVVYCLLMLQHQFIAPSINITELDDAAEGLDIVTTTRHTTLDTVMSNSFGFGGTNATLILKRWSS